MNRTVNEIELRIARLATKPVQNKALISKWYRILRKKVSRASDVAK